MQRKDDPISATRLFALLVPYIAVGVGLYLLHSAWSALLLYQLLMVLVLLFEGQWQQAGALLRPRNWLLVGLATLPLLSGVALYVIAPRLGLTTHLATVATSFGLTEGNWLPFILCFSFTNGWLEELYWRGYLGTPMVGFAWPDLWFAGYHAWVLILFIDWWWALIAVILLTGVAWAWRQIARSSGGLLLNAVSHIAADAGILLAVWLRVRG